jgi:hypothetical protein
MSVVPTVQDAAAATAGENEPDTKPAAMGNSQHRPGGPSPSLQPRKLLRRRHARPVHQVGAVSSRPESHRPSGHSSTLRGGHHPIRMSSDGDLRQWDTVLRRNVSFPPPGTWNCTSADTAIHAPGELRGKDEQNAEGHGGPVLRGRSKEVGRPSSGADVRPQHLTPRVDQVHASPLGPLLFPLRDNGADVPRVPLPPTPSRYPPTSRRPPLPEHPRAPGTPGNSGASAVPTVRPPPAPTPPPPPLSPATTDDKKTPLVQLNFSRNRSFV